MSGDLKRREETSAAELVAAHISGREIVSRSQGHDFDIRLANGQLVALEVTQAMVAEEIEAWKLLAGRDWQPKLVTMHWHLSVVKVPNVRQLVAAVEAQLVVLEGHEVYAMDRAEPPEAGTDSPDALRAIQELGRLGVRRASGFPETPPSITIGSTSTGTTSSDLVNRAVEAEAQKEDNRRKLREADADEAHLFVWIDSTKEQASVAMSDDAPPAAPVLPTEITTAWVALPSGRPERPARSLWRVTPPGDWEVLKRPSRDP